MDKTEHLAGLVINAAQVFIEKRLAPIVESLAAMKRDAAMFLTKGDLPDVDGPARLVAVMADEIKELRAELAARPTLEQVRAEQVQAGSKVAMELFGTLPIPKDGKSADPVDYEFIGNQISLMVNDKFLNAPKPKDGVDAVVDYDRIREMVRELPRPKDGDPGKDAVVDYDLVTSLTIKEVAPLIEDVIKRIPAPKDGPTLAEMTPIIDAAVARIPAPKDGPTLAEMTPIIDAAVARIPAPKDGVSVSRAEVKTMVNDEVARAVALIPAAEPGPRGKDADFALVKDMVQMSLDAAMANVRIPKDGDPGRDADPIDMDAVARLINGEVVKTLATWERPKDGADGLGFDDLSLDLKDDGRTIVHRYARGEKVKVHEIVAPWQIYRGVYVKGQRYQRGDSVTYAGSQFTAKTDTTQPPGTDDWVLSVKRGKDAAGEA